MSVNESPLRNLARLLREVARRHIAYSQVADFMNHVDSHLSSLAFAEENNQVDVTSTELAESLKAWLAGRSCSMAVLDERIARYRYYPDEFPDHQGHYKVSYEGELDVLELAQFVIQRTSK